MSWDALPEANVIVAAASHRQYLSRHVHGNIAEQPETRRRVHGWAPRKTSGFAKRAKVFPMKSKGNFSDSMKQGSFSRCPFIRAIAL